VYSKAYIVRPMSEVYVLLNTVFHSACSPTSNKELKGSQCSYYAQMEAENLDFFPMNRALALAREVDDETDTKLDELIAQVNLLVRKQRERVRHMHTLSRPRSHSLALCLCLSACVSVCMSATRLRHCTLQKHCTVRGSVLVLTPGGPLKERCILDGGPNFSKDSMRPSPNYFSHLLYLIIIIACMYYPTYTAVAEDFFTCFVIFVCLEVGWMLDSTEVGNIRDVLIKKHPCILSIISLRKTEQIRSEYS